MRYLKFLKSAIHDKKYEIKASQRSYLLFAILLIAGLSIGYVGLGIGGILGIVIILVGNACIIAGFMQLIGVCECKCPNCDEKGYIFKYSKEYKCKHCGTTSLVVKTDEHLKTDDE